MFLLIYYQSDLKFDQFDLNFGQIIYPYSGHFASVKVRLYRMMKHERLSPRDGVGLA